MHSIYGTLAMLTFRFTPIRRIALAIVAIGFIFFEPLLDYRRLAIAGSGDLSRTWSNDFIDSISCVELAGCS